MEKSKSSLLLVISLVLVAAVVFLAASSAFAQRTSAVGPAEDHAGPVIANNTSTPGQSKNKTGQLTAEAHRSTVANFVQTLLKTASSTEPGIGEQVRIIAREQNNSIATTTQAMERVQKRNKIKSFLIGSDYKNLGALRSEMVQTRNRLDQLNRVMGKTASTTELQTQIQILDQEQTKIEDFVKAQESKFSLFGWLVKLFKK